MIYRNQKGDTLIEVLLALAVVGLVLGVAYGAASRSSSIGRLAQERSEALKLAESQIERMKAMTTKDNADGLFDEPPSNSGFCVLVEGSPPVYDFRKVADDNPGCRIGFYRISNNYNPAPSSRVVAISVTWEQQGGNSGGTPPEVRMLYKLYQ